jgi:hypothetical protein
MTAYPAIEAKLGLADRSRVFCIVLVLLAAANCGIFLYFAEAASIRVPVYDLLTWLQFYGEQARTGHWLAYLWTPHNEHRIVLARMMLALDVRWFGGAGTVFFASGLVLLVAMLAAVCREIAKSNLAPSWKFAAMPLASLLLFPVHIVTTLGMPAMSPYLQTTAFALFALVLLDGAAASGRFVNWRRAMALIAACLAAFGVSAGLVIWPVLLWAAWRGRLPRVWIAAIVCVGSAFIAVYVWKLPLNGVHNAFAPSRIVESFDYAIRFLGLPWSHLDGLVWPARLIGCAVLCLGSFALVQDAVAGGSPGRLHRLALGLVLFSFLVAGSAVLARLNAATDRAMPIRYGTFVVLAQLGLFLWLVDFLQRYWQPADGGFPQWLIVALCAIWLCQQVIAGEYAVAEANRYNDAWSRFVAGAWTPDMLHYVFPDRQQALDGLANLRRMGLYGSK